MSATAGWYHAEGDPPGTTRYWDGELWRGDPQPAQASSVPPPPSSLSDNNPNLIETLTPFGYWKKCWTRSYANFDGRARRAEYGWFNLINWAVAAVFFVLMFVGGALSSFDEATGEIEDVNVLVWVGLALLALFSLASFVPGLAVTVRRWHDLGESGWMILLSVIPILNVIAALVLYFKDSELAVNKWGRSPKYG